VFRQDDLCDGSRILSRETGSILDVAVGLRRRQIRINAAVAMFDAARKLDTSLEHVPPQSLRSSGRFVGSTTVRLAANMRGAVPKRVGTWSPADRYVVDLSRRGPGCGAIGCWLHVTVWKPDSNSIRRQLLIPLSDGNY